MSIDRPTIKDIANRCGVSKTTVSFVFNNPDRVAPATRQMVKRIAQEMGYTPDPAARTLATKKTHSIGFLLPEVTPEGFKNPFLFLLLQGMRIGCMSTGYTLNVLSPADHQLMNTLQNTAMDGLIILGAIPEEEVFRYLEQRRLPVVSLDGGVKEEIPAIISDDENAAEMVVQRVLERGHRRILFLDVDKGDPPAPGYSPSVSRRRAIGHERGLKRFIQAHPEAAEAIETHQIICNECSAEGGKLGFARAWEIDNRRPTAVISFSDVMAMGVFEYCRDHKISIPEELSLVGFDDIHESTLLSPPLATVHQPAMAKGEQILHLLVDLILKKPTSDIIINTHFLDRESLGPPPEKA